MRRAVALLLMLCLTSAPAVEVRYTAAEMEAHQAALLRCGQEL
jgi:hypothetical protein